MEPHRGIWQLARLRPISFLQRASPLQGHALTMILPTRISAQELWPEFAALGQSPAMLSDRHIIEIGGLAGGTRPRELGGARQPRLGHLRAQRIILQHSP